MNIRILLLSFVLLLSSFLGFPVFADEQAAIDHVDTDFGVWPMFDVTFPLYKDKVSGYFFTLPIFINNARDLNPFIFRTAVIANPTKNLSLWLGYDRNANMTHKVLFNENRVWQQASWRHNFKNFDRLTVNGRFRVEERMFDVGGTSVRLRFRPGATFGLGKTRRWYLIANNEVLFYANNKKAREGGFAENRLFVGVGRKINPYVSVEAGYMPSLINSPGKKDDILRHYLVTYVSFRVPYKAPKLKAQSAVQKAPEATQIKLEPTQSSVEKETAPIEQVEIPEEKDDTKVAPVSLPEPEEHHENPHSPHNQFNREGSG